MLYPLTLIETNEADSSKAVVQQKMNIGICASSDKT